MKKSEPEKRKKNAETKCPPQKKKNAKKPSDTGLQYANGLRGALLVRPRGGAPKRKSDVGAAYDEERLLVVSDQAAATAETVFEELQAGGMSLATTEAGGAGAHGGGGGMGGGGMGLEAAAAEGPKAAAAHGRKRASRRRRRGLSQAAAAPAAAAPPHGGGAGMAAMGSPSPPPSSSPPPAASSSPPTSVDPQSGCFDTTTTQDISDAPYYATLVNGKGFALVSEPGRGPPAFAGSPAVVEVRKGKRYRFRLVNAGASWGYNVSVEAHPVALLALDGYPLAVSKAAADPKGGKSGGGGGSGSASAAGLRAVAGVVTTPGETVDFLLDASAPDGIRNYWINVLTLTGYGGPAVLHYGEGEKNRPRSFFPFFSLSLLLLNLFSRTRRKPEIEKHPNQRGRSRPSLRGG